MVSQGCVDQQTQGGNTGCHRLPNCCRRADIPHHCSTSTAGCQASRKRNRAVRTPWCGFQQTWRSSRMMRM
eukprot:5680794-Amphidinium_carterae.1